MWSEEIDEITVEYEEDGIQVVREEAKKVIARGAWPVLMFKYREWSRSDNDFGEPRYTIRKYRKRDGTYRLEAKFNIGKPEQAAEIARTLAEWAAADTPDSEI
ncbi:MAG TPA: hypothetical protein PLY68_04395 [Myxococcota bacterium]|nr:hypothetical protein [Myxococcota bacterium]HNZ04133.1 hypothetical protein [Myxococcota bacterium]HOD08025.1 hypothetical protein [Myxococcota bacterium]HPB50336.1 hypothetical protein [Myxococcota bacterium]HQP95418.1 hypothetical protein [Myxococcota bacterium]